MLCWCCLERFGPATERDTEWNLLLSILLWFCILELDRELLSLFWMDVADGTERHKLDRDTVTHNYGKAPFEAGLSKPEQF